MGIKRLILIVEHAHLCKEWSFKITYVSPNTLTYILYKYPTMNIIFK